MKSFVFNIFHANSIVFKNKLYLIAFLGLTLFLFWLFLYIPVRTIPGNDFAFQLSILRTSDILLMIILSILTALLLTLHYFMLRNKVSTKRAGATIGSGLFGSGAGIIGSLFASASCAVCVTTILGFLGVGTVFFLLDHRQLIIALSIMLMLISLHFTSQKVSGICNSCNNFHLKK